MPYRYIMKGDKPQKAISVLKVRDSAVSEAYRGNLDGLFSRPAICRNAECAADAARYL